MNKLPLIAICNENGVWVVPNNVLPDSKTMVAILTGIAIPCFYYLFVVRMK